MIDVDVDGGEWRAESGEMEDEEELGRKRKRKRKMCQTRDRGVVLK